jgi:hypothetical protein
MAYRGYLSSFDGNIIPRLRQIDFRDPAAVATGIVDVRGMLATRLREELVPPSPPEEKSNPMSCTHARARIIGSIVELRQVEYQARGHDAPSAFLDLIAEVAREAHEASERAPRPASRDAEPAPELRPPDAWWVTAPIPEPSVDGVRTVVVDLGDI